MDGDDFFVAGPRQDTAKMRATLKRRWETRDQVIGSKPDDQKERRILNRTLRWCKGGLVFAAANLRRCREVVDELQVEASFVSGQTVLLDAKMTSPSHSMKRNACISES